MAGDEVYFSRIYGSYLMNMSVNGRYRIDFVNQSGCVVPDGSILNIPGRAVNNLYIRNDGPCAIQYSVNGASIEDMIGGVMTTGQNRDIKFKDTNLKSVNIFVITTTNSLFSTIDIEVTV